MFSPATTLVCSNITDPLGDNLNLWCSCLLMLNSHSKKHRVKAETTLGWTGLPGNMQNAHLHRPHTSTIHLNSLQVWWATIHSHLELQLSAPSQRPPLLPPHDCLRAATLPKPISTSKLLICVKAEVQYSLYLCISQLFNKCKLPTIY